jgi:hypothetical protein
MGSKHSEPDNHNESEIEIDDDALELAAGGFPILKPVNTTRT